MSKKAILLANLGSPDSAEPKSIRRYLNQFLMDPYVIQLPWLLRRLIVSLFVLPSRPKVSAKAYQSIWFNDGSPLIVLSQRLKVALQKKVDMPVAMAMRYGKPSIENQILELAEQPDISEIVFIPLYPHYAESTVTTSVEQARLVIKKHALNINLTVIKPFYDNPDYISALVNSAQAYLEQDYDHILFSYHGLPESHIRKLDKSAKNCLVDDHCLETDHTHQQSCYLHQVFRTTDCFVEKVGIAEEKYSIAFQSRLGKAKWLGPNTEDRLRELAADGNKNILVICPAFVTDCLETLEEIAIRGQEVFKEAGGESLTLVPCLNDQAEWVDVLASWCQ
jgi:ferrochelatase